MTRSVRIQEIKKLKQTIISNVTGMSVEKMVELAQYLGLRVNPIILQKPKKDDDNHRE